MTNKKTNIICLLLFAFITTNMYAQASQELQQDSIPQKDFIDVLHALFKSKKTIIDSSTIKTPKKYVFSVFPIIGYTLQSSLAADLSSNLVYRNGKNDTTSLSAIVAGVSYTAKKQLLFYLQSNIWSENNEWNFTGDIRIYKYPQSTYGLGGYTKETDDYLVNHNFLRLYETAFKRINKNMYLGVGYMLDKHWNITKDRTNTDFDSYGYKKESISSGLSASFLADTRDNPINASKGFFSNFIVRYNTTLLGSNDNWTSLVVDLRKYVKLGKKHTVLGFWTYDWFTLSGKAPYLDLPSTAWDPFNNLGRGYTQSRFRSPNLLYAESELRFNITKNQLIGAVVFANAQSYSEWTTKKFETILPGFGTGIRLKFNKHSRTNLAVDYAFGLNGSGGLFVNFGEIF